MQRLCSPDCQMKKKMKALVFIVAVSLLLFSCKKSQPAFMSNGVITGVDVSQCPCRIDCPCACGGLIFHFTDTTNTSRVLLDNASDLRLSPDVKFPVQLKLNWVSTNRCGMNAIKITGYKIL